MDSVLSKRSNDVKANSIFEDSVRVNCKGQEWSLRRSIFEILLMPRSFDNLQFRLKRIYMLIQCVPDNMIQLFDTIDRKKMEHANLRRKQFLNVDKDSYTEDIILDILREVNKYKNWIFWYIQLMIYWVHYVNYIQVLL